MADRDTLLAGIAGRVSRRPLASAPSIPPAPAPPAIDALVDQFVAELQLLTGVVHRAAGPDEAIAAVLAVCARHQSSRVLAWTEEACGLPGLDAALRGAGVEPDRGWLPDGPAERLARLAVLETILVGVTGGAAAIAESGTIALVSGPGRPRIASLLPPVHVAVVPVSRLYPTLPAFLTAHPHAADESSNLVLITGPSRTADIEMTLTRGVHGPGEVHVVLLP